MSVVERALERLRGRNQKPVPSITPRKASPNVVGSPASDGNSAEVEAKMTISRRSLRSAGYLPEERQDRKLADEYRRVKRTLLAKAYSASPSDRRNPRLIAMVSALPGDGKTFTSINLALSIARERDSTVLLVDADVAKPHISRIFGAEGEPGLLDILSDSSVEASSLVLPTDVRGLSILPAGKTRDGSAELLASAKMQDFVEGLLVANPRLVIVLDTSPLLVSSESRSIAAISGQVLLVVRAGRTPRRAIEEAIAELETVVPSEMISLVLNQGRKSVADALYGYGQYGDENARDSSSY